MAWQSIMSAVHISVHDPSTPFQPCAGCAQGSPVPCLFMSLHPSLALASRAACPRRHPHVHVNAQICVSRAVCEMGVMLVRNSERSKALFERLDGMASESWVSPSAMSAMLHMLTSA